MKTCKNLVSVAILIVSMFLANVGFAQKPAIRAQKGINLRAALRETLAITPKAGQRQELFKMQEQYSREELAQAQSAVLDLIDSIKDLTELTPGNFNVGRLDEQRKQLATLSDEQLGRLRRGLDVAKMSETLAAARATIAEYKLSLTQQGKIEMQTPTTKNVGVLTPDTNPFPTVSGLCHAPGSTGPGTDYGPNRIPVGVILAADIVYFVAELARDVAHDICDEVVVIAGEGGNTSAAVCPPFDVTYGIAHAVYAGIHFCDNDLTGNVIDTNYARLFHIHGDLEASVANDNANKTAIINNDDSNKTAIINNDDSNKTAIINNDNSNKTAIINNDDSNKTSIINNDNSNTTTIVSNENANRTTIVNNDNANATGVRDLILRLQIEADLAMPDNSVPVALFETPSTECFGLAPVNHCGQLDFVRKIVVQTISRLGGSSAAQANAFLAKGDQYVAAGNYKSAYQQYRQAYKAAAK